MSHWDDLRARARRCHASAWPDEGMLPTAAALLDGAAALTGTPRRGLRAGHRLLDGAEAVFDAQYGETGMIWLNKDIAAPTVAYYAAHEYAHVWLHRGAWAHCTGADLDPLESEEEGLSSTQRVEGYSLHERREREANAFAQEFLLPTDRLRRWHRDHGLSAPQIAAQLGVPLALVYHQLTRALLLPAAPDAGAAEAVPGVAPSAALDPSQAAAAVADGPFLLQAGPGTGKTHTLVARVTHLLERGVAPGAILALTFSNKAAEELRTRVAAVAPEAAPQLWIGTFHAFGLELLRKYGARIALESPRLIDPLEAVVALEAGLGALDLRHYQNLYEPTMHLPDLLAAISRAKDYLIDAATYGAEAEAMQAAVSDDSDERQRRAAERAVEVARVYRYYQDHLEREGLVDFGDLIARPVALLQGHPAVRAELRRRYTQVLVDEYQDVNRASALLLRELAGDGRGLWVVGDARQAIYRFRGANPTNMRLFAETDFPGATVQTLTDNYRSRREIVDTVAALAPQMVATRDEPFSPWQVTRGGVGTVQLQGARDERAEAALLAQEIARQHAAGVSYRDQAVLCRSHTTLGRLAAALEGHGLPVLYLGNLFDRPEVRDLLALLSLCSEGHGRGLVRVARFPEYAIPLADVQATLALSREHSVPFPRALTLALNAPGLSAAGHAGLARLAAHLEVAGYRRAPWNILMAYLFDRSRYLRDRLDGAEVAAQQRRLAVYSLLQLALDQRRRATTSESNPTRAFLEEVRRLVIVGEERALRQVPEAASGIDAVRLLTVHASKGLEFGRVYLPALVDGTFPATERREPCPPPTGLRAQLPTERSRDEEECLFFVALSRARDHLHLSLAGRYGKVTRRPSPLLALIAACVGVPAVLPAPECEAGEGAVAAPPSPQITLPPAQRPLFTVADLDLYRSCPRRYYYDRVVGLGGRSAETAYVQFHRCVYIVVRWLGQEREVGVAVDEAGALARLAEVWAEQGPRDHAYSDLYRDHAQRMVRRAMAGPAGRGGRRAAPVPWEVPLTHGRVAVQPDNVIIDESGERPQIVVQRLRTGRLTGAERDEPIYALYQRAVELTYPRATVQLEAVSLSSGERQEITLKPTSVETRLGTYDAASVGILDGAFAASPEARRCPRCPFYFICPSGEA